MIRMKANDMTIKIAISLQAVMLVAVLWLTTVDVEKRWSCGDLWLASAVPVVAVVSATLCLVLGRKLRISIADAIVTLWWIFENVLVYVGYGVVTPTAFMTFTGSVLLYVALRLLFTVNHIDWRIIAGGIMAVCLYQCFSGFAQLFTGISRHAVYPVTGCFLNPGPYSAFITIGLCIALCCMYKDGKKETADVHAGHDGIYGKLLSALFRLLAVSVTICGMVMLPVTWSRAAVVAVVAVAAVLYRRYWLRYWFAVVPVVAAAMLLLYHTKSGSADSRLLMWTVSLGCIKSNFLFGGGIGSFPFVYGLGRADFYADNNSAYIDVADVTDNAFNEFLTLCVEQGTVGMLLFAALLAVVFLRLHANSRALKYGLAALLVFSMFSYPFHCLPYRILLAVICAWAVSMPSGKGLVGGKRCIIAITAVVFTVGMLLHGETGRRVEAADSYRQISGIDVRYVIDDYYELLPYLDDNPDFLFSFAKGLAELGRYNDSNCMLRLGTKVSNDPMFLVCMANNYYKMGEPHTASEYYMHAFDMLPNRVYPLYKLMLLYHDEGDAHNAYKAACSVMEFKEKVSSPATMYMKTKAKDIVSTGSINESIIK
ncbi:O-antigen ligase family protein [Xylanibacter muris]|uniref:O-antigen ligase-related domain-containing protein n=1 Tax=Xylanibacter muris TaxID=2736290 RepID=A0ABX2AKB4_9BACT|nr:O-antigen ligase family protein [Xylanibacter muris]NPD91638.1 hypothetical protein [Xylanibacter muris]